PTEYKINRGITKLVLREAMKDVLPEAVRLRTDKIGFETPEEQWLKSEAPAKFIGELKKAPEITGGLITEDAVSLANNLIAGREVFSNLPWRLISFTKWYERYSLKH
ncbi:MAG: asparagine synthase-related protein, partial [Dethiobacteria bacterium]|nr:asparagine synthase-related protein [Dethiobacteria bacterium]